MRRGPYPQPWVPDQGPAQTHNYVDSISPRFVRAVLLAFLATAILSVSPIVSAESYKISGTATYSNSPPVSMEEVRIDCAEFEYDCHPFRDIGSQTDRNGAYEISIELDETYDGAELILVLLGEPFYHTIDIDESRSPPSGTVSNDIQLEQESPPSALFTGVGCAGLFIALAFFAALDRKPSRGQMAGVRTRAPDIAACPVCAGRVERYLLIRHLIVDHEIDPSEASGMAESVDSEQE